MKVPQVIFANGVSTYLGERHGNYGWEVANTYGGAVAGDLRVAVFISQASGFSGTPGQEGERDEVDDWNLLTGRQGGTGWGWHVYWQWWSPSGPTTSQWFMTKVDDRPFVYMGMVLYVIRGADPANPIELDGAGFGTDPDDTVIGQGYADREQTGAAGVALGPIVDIAGPWTTTAPTLMLLTTTTTHDFGANNMWQLMDQTVGMPTTAVRRVTPIFPSGSFDDTPPGKPGTACGTGWVMYGRTGIPMSVGKGPDMRWEIWRYLDDPQFAELAYQESVTFPEDPNPPIADLVIGTCRLAIRGKPSGLVAMI